MKHRPSLFLAAAMLAGAAGCNKSPAEPSSATAAAPASAAATPSIVAPRPATPVNNAAIRNVDQPVTLVVQNAISTKPGLTYMFEVASDAAFATKVQTKDAVGEGNPTTNVRLDALPPAADYWWHARASGGGTTGVFGPAFKFSVGPAITINAPVPISPLTGARTGTRPPLRVTNATRTGPAGAITYRFEISTSPTFTPIVATAINTEGVNETGFVPAADLAANTGFFWRAVAIDAVNGVFSPPSAVQSFVTADPLWMGIQPPPGGGRAVKGLGWDIRTVRSFSGVTFESPRLEVSQVFDLLDRGFTPQGALDWMNSNGYPTEAVWYPGPVVIGFVYEYLAFVHGTWELVIRAGA